MHAYLSHTHAPLHTHTHTHTHTPGTSMLSLPGLQPALNTQVRTHARAHAHTRTWHVYVESSWAASRAGRVALDRTRTRPLEPLLWGKRTEVRTIARGRGGCASCRGRNKRSNNNEPAAPHSRDCAHNTHCSSKQALGACQEPLVWNVEGGGTMVASVPTGPQQIRAS